MDKIINLVIVSSAFLASLAFCITYHMVAKWWKNDFGKSLMIYQASMTLILGMSVGSSIFGRPTWLVVIGLIVLAVVPITLVWRIIVLLKVQRTRGGTRYDH